MVIKVTNFTDLVSKLLGLFENTAQKARERVGGDHQQQPRRLFAAAPDLNRRKACWAITPGSLVAFGQCSRTSMLMC